MDRKYLQTHTLYTLSPQQYGQIYLLAASLSLIHYPPISFFINPELSNHVKVLLTSIINLSQSDIRQKILKVIHIGHMIVFPIIFGFIWKLLEMFAIYVLRHWRYDNLLRSYYCFHHRLISYFHILSWYGRHDHPGPFPRNAPFQTWNQSLIMSYKTSFLIFLFYTKDTSKDINIFANTTHWMSLNSFIWKINTTSNFSPLEYPSLRRLTESWKRHGANFFFNIRSFYTNEFLVDNNEIIHGSINI